MPFLYICHYEIVTVTSEIIGTFFLITEKNANIQMDSNEVQSKLS